MIGTGTKPHVEMPKGCRYVQLKLEDRQSVGSLCRVIEGEAPHILVNNAGQSSPGAIEDLDMADVERIHEINLVAPMRLCQAAVKGMKRHGWGRIVNITAVSGIWGVVATDFLQYVLAIGGAFAVMCYALAEVGGIGDLVATLKASGQGATLDLVPTGADAMLPLSTFFGYVFIQWWAFRNSDGGGLFVQRLSSVKDEAEARKATHCFNVLNYVVRTWPWVLVALGKTATVHLAQEGGGSQAKLPLAAVFKDEGQPSVWLIDEPHGRLTKKNVEIGAWTETSAIVTGGLEAGQKIVAAGVHKLDAGIPVRIVEVVK